MTRQIFLAVALFGLVACQRDAQAQALKTDQDKTFYALGASIGKSLGVFSLTKSELELVKRGLTDQATKQKLQVEIEPYQQKIQELAQERGKVRAEEEKKASVGLLEKAAHEKGAQKTASGLVYTELKAGTGEQPKATDTVKVHYRGTLSDGTEFDSSHKRGQPAEFPLNGVIPCWTEGVQKMKVGGKAKLVCPSSIAYGDRGTGPIPGGATLTFEVELLDVVHKDAPKDAPPTTPPPPHPGKK